MRRADRLFEIIQLLRTRRITTARWLAEQLEISERTIYRDIQDLMMSGVPIEGEAGVGYILRKSFDLPPLMFTEQEITALTLGARIVKSWADPELARAAQQVLSKVEVVLPDRLQKRLSETNLFAPFTQIPPEVSAAMAVIRPAIDARSKVKFDYTRADGQLTTRTVWPLGLFFWGATWTMGAWCEHRQAFRNFRLDRIDKLNLAGDKYPNTPGRTLNDLIQAARNQD